MELQVVDVAQSHDNVLQKNFLKIFRKNLGEHWRNKSLSDVVLIAGVDGTRVHAHRLVLCASSNYFSGMFSNSMFSESNNDEVIISEFAGNELYILVEFCYTGSVAINDDNVKSVLIAANYLLLEGAANACENFLANTLCLTNFLDLMNFAENYNCSTLLRLTTEYIIKHFMEVLKTENFLKLNSNQLSVLLKSDYLNVPTEFEVFNSLLYWIRYDRDSRKELFPELFALIYIPPIIELINRMEFNTNEKLISDTLKLSLFEQGRSRPRNTTLGNY